MSAARPSVLSAPGGHGHQRHLETPGIGDEIGKLGRLPRPGKRQNHILRRDHAEIAVACLGRMHELGRRSGGRKRGGDLLPDMAALAHAGHDDPALAAQHQLRRLFEVLRKPIGQCGPQRLHPLDLAADAAFRHGRRHETCMQACGPAARARGSPILFPLESSTPFGARFRRRALKGYALETPPSLSVSSRGYSYEGLTSSSAKSFFNSSLNFGARSGRASAKATLALKKPSLEPQS